MTRRFNRGEIPSDMGWLIDWMDEQEEAMRALQAPTGSQTNLTSDVANGTVAYLAGLTTTVVTGGNTTQVKANDGTFSWYNTTAPQLVIADLPALTGRIMVTVNVGEARLTPLGADVQSLVSYSVEDSLGAFITAIAAPGRYGRVLFNQRLYIGIRTPEIPLVIDPVVNPGPYTIKGFVGAYASTLNSGPVTFTWNDCSLRVDVLAPE